jgi:hypothetical protein
LSKSHSCSHHCNQCLHSDAAGILFWAQVFHGWYLSSRPNITVGTHSLTNLFVFLILLRSRYYRHFLNSNGCCSHTAFVRRGTLPHLFDYFHVLVGWASSRIIRVGFLTKFKYLRWRLAQLWFLLKYCINWTFFTYFTNWCFY